MKTTKVILGCALATGLMTLAASQAQAVVIDNVLYSPLNIKATATYESGNKLKTVSVNSKDVLKDLGFNSNVKLAVSDFGFPDDQSDVWVINKNTTVQDLTEAGKLTISNDEFVFGGEDEASYTEAGLTEIDFYQTPVFFEDSDEVDQASSEDASANWLEVGGAYSFKGKQGNNDSLSEKYTTKTLSGEGFFESLEQEGEVPVTGSASYSGSGKDVDID